MAKKINRKKLEEVIKDVVFKLSDEMRKTPAGTLVHINYNDLIDELTTQVGIFVDKENAK